MTTASPSIAVTSTLAMLRTAEARGIAVGDVLGREGVSRALLEDPDARLPASTVIAIWNTLRERCADPALQLAAPTSLPFGAYRVIDYLVAASVTVGDGVQRFARFFGLIAEGVSLSVAESAGGRCLCLATSIGGPVPPVYVDYVFAALVSRIRMRIRPALRVRSVDLRQSEPKASAPWRDVFQAPIRFGAPADRLCFDVAEWKAPTENGDAALVALLEEHARIMAQRTPRASSGFPEEVQRAIASRLPEGASIEEVAGALSMSVRTLQRKLIASGTTFRHASEAVMARLAEGYLTDPAVSVSEVAFLLGFSEQSAFNRAFRRWTGESPGRWRRRGSAGRG